MLLSCLIQHPLSVKGTLKSLHSKGGAHPSSKGQGQWEPWNTREAERGWPQGLGRWTASPKRKEHPGGHS